jgi:parallel beta-helix repeat protein
VFAACSGSSGSTANVRTFGATGDGVTDDTEAMQAAFDSLADGGTIEIPDGTYLVHATGSVGALRPHSHQRVELSDGAVVQHAPTDADEYEVFQLLLVDDVTVTGGTQVGDRDSHLGSTGEWGHGVGVRSSTNITIDGVTARDFWGDGFYIGRNYADPPPSEHVTVRNVVADHNRRQGISITDATDVLVENSTFQNTGGTPPEAGIDLEPWGPELTATQITLRGNTTTNGSYGILLVGGAGPTYDNLVIENHISNNRIAGIQLIGTGGGICLTSNTVSDNVVGIAIWGASNDNDIGMNQITGSAGDNLDVCSGSSRNTIHDNVIRSGGTAPYGIHVKTADCGANSILRNDLADAGTVTAVLDLGTGTVISGNSP